MAPIFTPTIVLPPYALALFIALVVSLLVATATWIFVVHRRRFSLPIPTTQVEAQVQVQVQVEKIHDPTPPRSSSWLGLPFVACAASSPSDSWFQRILRRHSKEPANVAISDPQAAERPTPTLPPLDCQPPSPRPVKKEMWFAFDSDATLATLRGDPLGEFYFKASCRDPVSSSTASTPSLVYDKSAPPSPLSTWEPLTPPPIVEEDLTRTAISIVPESSSKAAFEKNEETDYACPSPLLGAPEETRLSLPSVSMASSVCTLIHDTSIPEPGDIYAPAGESDCDVDLKVSCKRLAALIDAISVSFSASTLGPPFSRRTTKTGFEDFDLDDNSFSIGDDYDLPQCSDDDEPEPDWDLGTTTLHESISQREYSILAI